MFSTIEEASRWFLSLIDYVKEGNDLDNITTEQTFTNLESLVPGSFRNFAITEILFKLVPTRDRSCSGFSESIMVLLTSSNDALVESALLLLNGVLSESYEEIRFDVLVSGLFALFPQAFFEQDMHLVAQPRLLLMRIIKKFISPLDVYMVEALCKQKHIPMRTFEKILLDKFFHPLEPFLVFIVKNRHRITDSYNSRDFSKLLGRILEYSLKFEHVSQFVLSSPIALALTDTLSFFETDFLTLTLLWRVQAVVKRQRKEKRAVSKRKQQLVAKLCGEGLIDVCELHFQTGEVADLTSTFVFLGLRGIDGLGGNVPCDVEMEL
ncbi:hypothetical protein BLNAU_3051 [Blattamonas nauphoetae]|uniref:Uncharacterized protein n=1 Tax=Blattamonas nauphoetae TaxID=2049346 RepID=A0ABQ9YE55_9EUKA|nr:hypothetical protein BLNAU_3051 [Blattamonas nauphoetae]